MLGVESVFLVRHGSDDLDSLNEVGVSQAEKACDELLLKGLGGCALILSSSAGRAMQTAEIIGRGLQADIFSSDMIRDDGQQPLQIRDLDQWIDQVLEKIGVKTGEGQRLVVVTHAPLIGMAKGINPLMAATSVEHGEVYEYLPGSWKNPLIRDDFEEY